MAALGAFVWCVSLILLLITDFVLGFSLSMCRLQPHLLRSVVKEGVARFFMRVAYLFAQVGIGFVCDRLGAVLRAEC